MADKYTGLISEYLDGMLSAEKKAELEAHLKTCAGCSKELETLKNNVHSLKKIRPLPLPEGFMQGLSAKLDLVDEEKKRKVFWVNFMKSTAALTAMLFAVVFIKQIYEDSGIKKPLQTYEQGLVNEKKEQLKVKQPDKGLKKAAVPLLVDEVPAGRAVMTDEAEALSAPDKPAAPAPEEETAYEFGVVRSGNSVPVGESLRTETRSKKTAISGMAKPEAGAPVTYEQIYYGEQSGMAKSSQVVIKNPSDMKAMLIKAPEISARHAFLKDIDFTQSVVVLIFAGKKPTAGYYVKAAVKETQDDVTVSYGIMAPPKDALLAQVITTPYCAIILPKTTKRLVIKEE